VHTVLGREVENLSRKIPLTAYIDNEAFNALEDLSRQSGESVSSLVRKAVSEFLKRKTEEAA